MRFLSARAALSIAAASIAALCGCSSLMKSRESKVFPAGEKATVDRLTYSVVDTEIHPRLGEDANPRIPQTRFLLVQVAVSNSSNEDISIPSLALVDDSGKTYNELPDGRGIPRWLGMVRKVSPGQTEQGVVAFDAPAAHYRLKLTDETSDSDVFADVPLSYVHEQQANDAPSQVLVSPDPLSETKK